ncbi:MAG: hypothetical protein QNJ44_04250 [Rhodobacter sp.]|nr:hypothetical protein [Rhodobacter sp.]
MRCLAIFVLCLVPALATAGAWPREQGKVFLSLSHTLKGDPATMLTYGIVEESYTAVYLEYGLTAKTTVGLDAGYADGGDYTVLVFARRPVGPGTGRNIFALKAGAGTARMGNRAQSVLMAGAHWGRGLNTLFGDGWLSLETGLHYFTARGETAAKADLTLGVKPGGKNKVMLQVQAGQYPGSDAYLRLVPSVATQLRKGLHVEMGAEAGLVGDDRIGLKLGTWLEF